ncbi:hypothetical protein GW866_01125 [bacterium]|nr:hypothetical protein [bacterium]OIO85227.1 MAG: hypothetical protein AUK02_06710 [Anaerolineae bacterium CG2_30_58_95]PIW19968.1 MAG: hypothetical protein COW33_03860 [Anaerolineae bacterium CG17_big_fil_post_rev_8_21_14_2_50_57_27]
MPITYTNRKGFTYFLCKGTTKTGKARYYFAREQKGEPVAEIPPGYEIEESVNGIVSLVKARPRLIPAEEAASVEAALQRHPKGRNYRLAVKHDRIVIYEGVGPDIEGLKALSVMMGMAQETFEDRLRVEMESYTQFTAVMQFILDDPERREYHAERWCYRGSIDDWIYAGHSGKIDQLARTLIPTLGTDDFYELY